MMLSLIENKVCFKAMDGKKIRMIKILDLLKENKTMSVKALADIFHVSEMTIRRDLEFLKKNNAIDRSYGYATLQDIKQVPIDNGEYYDITLEQIKHSAEKESIAKYAATLIEPQDVIIIDSGTTTYRFSKYLPRDQEFTALCYNFSILAELRKHAGINIIFAGGYYYPEDQMFTSKENVEFIRSLRANKAFISASGFHENLGITCIHSHEVENKKAAIASSATKILLMDSSKFGLVRSSFFASLSDIDILITDSGISKEWRKIVIDKGIDLHVT